MSKFNTGDRIKVVAYEEHPSVKTSPVGMEGSIVQVGSAYLHVVLDKPYKEDDITFGTETLPMLLTPDEIEHV